MKMFDVWHIQATICFSDLCQVPSLHSVWWSGKLKIRAEPLVVVSSALGTFQGDFFGAFQLKKTRLTGWKQSDQAWRNCENSAIYGDLTQPCNYCWCSRLLYSPSPLFWPLFVSLYIYIYTHGFPNVYVSKFEYYIYIYLFMVI